MALSTVRNAAEKAAHATCARKHFQDRIFGTDVTETGDLPSLASLCLDLLIIRALLPFIRRKETRTYVRGIKRFMFEASFLGIASTGTDVP